MQKWKLRGADLLFSLAIKESENPAVIPYTPGKTRLFSEKPPMLTRARRGSRQISEARLLSLVEELEACESANIHNLLVTSGGELVLECSAPGHSCRIARLSHSMSKTITSLAIGMLFDDGMLDLSRPVFEIFPEIPYKDRRFERITVRHLLTMTSGVSFGELGSVTEERWTEAFFLSEFGSAPGEKFTYNSMNSYILSRIVERISGENITRFLEKRLLAPLEINDFFWETSPEGYEKGGFGIYMSAESFAKIGELFLNDGIYGKYRIISEEYLKLATEDTVSSKDSKSDFDYGYHIWVGKERDELLINGLFGQNVWIYREGKTVAVINAANKELFSESEALFILRNNLKNAPFTDGGDKSKRKRLAMAEASFFDRRRFASPIRKHPLLRALGFGDEKDRRLFSYLMREWAFPKNNKSILPLTQSVLANNYSGGIESFRFDFVRGGICMTVREKNAENRINLGFYSFMESVLYISGEKYLVRGIIAPDRERIGEYKIELAFPELPTARYIRLTLEGERLIVRLTELPDHRLLDRFLASTPSDPKIAFILSRLEKRLGAGFAKDIARRAFSPTLAAISTAVAGYRELLDDESELMRIERESSSGFLLSLYSIFIGDSDAEEGAKERSSLSRAISGIFRLGKKGK